MLSLGAGRTERVVEPPLVPGDGAVAIPRGGCRMWHPLAWAAPIGLGRPWKSEGSLLFPIAECLLSSWQAGCILGPAEGFQR